MSFSTLSEVGRENWKCQIYHLQLQLSTFLASCHQLLGERGEEIGSWHIEGRDDLGVVVTGLTKTKGVRISLFQSSRPGSLRKECELCQTTE